MLESELNLIKEYKEKFNQDIMAFSDVVIVTENKEFIKRRSSFKKIAQGKILDKIMTRSCEVPLDFIMSREMYFAVGGYNPKFVIFEDWDLNIKLASKYQFFLQEMMEQPTCSMEQGFLRQAIELRLFGS